MGKAFETEVWLTRTLDENGVQLFADMEWRPPWVMWHPRLSALWSVQRIAPLASASGVFFMRMSSQEEARKRRVSKLALELATEVRPSAWPNALIAGRPEAQLEHGLHGAWLDVLAYARGAPALFAVLRDQRGRPRAQTNVSPAIFLAGERAIAEGLKQMEEVSKEFRSRCVHEDDVKPDIVVT